MDDVDKVLRKCMVMSKEDKLHVIMTLLVNMRADREIEYAIGRCDPDYEQRPVDMPVFTLHFRRMDK